MAYSAMTDLAAGDFVTEAEWDKIKGNFDAAFPFAPDTAWGTWSPTLANITVGNGTTTAVYKRVGRFIFYNIKFVLGSTSAMGTAPTFTLPVTAATRYAVNADSYGTCQFFDTSAGAVYAGSAVTSSTTVANFFVLNTASTYASVAGVTATAPFTWATGDAIQALGFYESAA